MENIKKNLTEIVIAAELAIVIAASLICFNRTEGKESKTENRYLASFPALKSGEGGISPTLKEDLESWFEDNLGLRDAYLTLSGAINYNILNRSKTDRVEIGKEGFLYLADEGNLEMAAKTSGPFIEKIPEYAQKIEEVNDGLKAQGIDYAFMIAPGKPSVYPEYIASSTHTIGETVGDSLCDYLRENTDVKVIWPKDKLIEAKDDPEGKAVYLKTDTHWTTYGRNIAYRDMIGALNGWGMSEQGPAEVCFSVTEGPFAGDLSDMMGPVSLTGRKVTEESFIDWKPVDIRAVQVESGERYEAFQNLMYEKNVYNPILCAMFHNDSVPKKSALILGDSMIGVCMLPELAECFSDLTFVWSYRVDQDFIDFVQPDIVISEYGERELDLRLKDIDTGFRR
jgi:hypothetical protein